MTFRDGESHNLSWNCGEEGETKTPSVLRLRSRQIRNMAAALLLSHGVPMIQMGDEYGHSKVCQSQSALCVMPQKSAAARAEHHEASQPVLHKRF
jgi:pullulanase/glycogen debranching enzyme